MDQNQLNNLRNIAQAAHNLEASRIARETAAATNQLLRSQEQQRALEQQRLAVEQQRLQEEQRRADLAAQEQERRRELAEAEAEKKEAQAARVKFLRIEMVALEEEIAELSVSLSNPETPPPNVSGVPCATYLFLLLQKKLGMLLSKKSSLHDLNDIRFLGQLEKSVGKLPKSFPTLFGDGATSKAQQYLKELVDWPSKLVTQGGTEVCPSRVLQKIQKTAEGVLAKFAQAESEIHSTESISSLRTNLAEQEQSLASVEAALTSSWAVVSPQVEELTSMGLGIVEIRTIRGSGIPHLSECLIPVARLRQGLSVCRQILRDAEVCREQDLQSVVTAGEHLKAGAILEAHSAIAALQSRIWSDIGLEAVKNEISAAQDAALQRVLAELDVITATDPFAAVRQTEAETHRFASLEPMFSALLLKRTELLRALEARLLAEITQIGGKHLHNALKHSETLMSQAAGLPDLQAALAEKKAVIGIDLKNKGTRSASVWMAIVVSVGLISFFDFLSGGQFGRLLGDQWSARLYSLQIPGILMGSSLLSFFILSLRDIRIQKSWKDLEDTAKADARKFRESAADIESKLIVRPTAAGGTLEKVPATSLIAAITLIRDTSEFKRIPSGSFLMGSAEDEEDEKENGPIHEVWVSSFLIATTVVTFGEWRPLSLWAQTQGYVFTNEGAGVSDNHPATDMNWYDAVKWCNAKSEIEGLIPCYKINGTVLRSGEESSVTCDWDANGYRLPTEAEWEKAARGGLVGKRWPNGDQLEKKDANIDASGPVAVGKYPSNGYGLYDMAGNVAEWCWDWYDEDYSCEFGFAPRRSVRGGGYSFCAEFCSVTSRRGDGHTDHSNDDFGLRLVCR